MKDPRDQGTAELLPMPKKRGRPASGTAKSNAERQRDYRTRHTLVPAGDLIPETIRSLAEQFDMTVPEVTRELLRFALCNKNWRTLGFPSPGRNKAKDN